MGHANYTNLCDLWINLLYAKGRLTIGHAVAVADKRGEELHASEGGYDAESGMIGVAFEEYCKFLMLDVPGINAPDSGWRLSAGEKWLGPYIEPILDVKEMMPHGFHPLPSLKKLMKACAASPDDKDLHAVTCDAIAEESVGARLRFDMDEWSKYVRDLPELRGVFKIWNENLRDYDDDWETLDRVPWRFCKGKRVGYRDIPRIGSVTN